MATGKIMLIIDGRENIEFTFRSVQNVGTFAPMRPVEQIHSESYPIDDVKNGKTTWRKHINEIKTGKTRSPLRLVKF